MLYKLLSLRNRKILNNGNGKKKRMRQLNDDDIKALTPTKYIKIKLDIHKIDLLLFGESSSRSYDLYREYKLIVIM